MKQSAFSVAAIFSDHMVLQREKEVCVFGEGPEGEKVTVEFSGHIGMARVKDGKWRAWLPPMDAGEAGTLAVVCGTQVRLFEDVCVGEVWLAGGQSNMEYELSRSVGGLDLLTENACRIRYYQVPRRSSPYLPLRSEERKGWQLFEEGNARSWSAVAVFFAKKLSDELGVTVGIIGCCWGGTSGSCWISEEDLQESASLAPYWTEYVKRIKGVTLKRQIREYQVYETSFTDWNKKATALWKTYPELSWPEVEKMCGDSGWPGPVNSVHPFRPSGLYHTMLCEISPYTLKGFCYYQGESDEDRAKTYEKLLSALVSRWRTDWENDRLIFLMVQLPAYQNKLREDDKSWCLIREAQMKVWRTMKNTGLAVTMDCGEYNEIHPSEKRKIGERLALQALCVAYHKIEENEACGPILRTAHSNGRDIELSFFFAENGLLWKEMRLSDQKSNSVTAFEIAGNDRHFRKACAKIEGNQIRVWSGEVAEPCYVRYCWHNYVVPIIYGSNGLPLAPFRNYC